MNATIFVQLRQMIASKAGIGVADIGDNYPFLNMDFGWSKHSEEASQRNEIGKAIFLFSSRPTNRPTDVNSQLRHAERYTCYPEAAFD